MSESSPQDRLSQAFDAPAQKLLSIFYTAGFPRRDDTMMIASQLQEAGADMLEIGFPFSDPLADGPTIQASNERALRQGMSLSVLFEQLKSLRETITIPVLLMGYLNPVMQFGVEAFFQKCEEVGIDGLILPDLPLELYLDTYKPLFDKHNLKTVWLITPRTSDERVRLIDEHTTGFIYVVSSYAVTGNQLEVDQQKRTYFERIRDMKLKSPLMVGFGIHDAASFHDSTLHASGGIIGSAFLKAIQRADTRQVDRSITRFVRMIRTGEQSASMDSSAALEAVSGS